MLQNLIIASIAAFFLAPTTVNGQCQGKESGELVANPIDCTTFYQCTESGAVKLTCPAGLHFSPRTLECKYPNQAGCMTDDDESAQIPCPGEDDPTKLIFFPSERNCAWCYLCLSGRAQRLECGPGLHWNQEEMKCDLPDKANCKVCNYY